MKIEFVLLMEISVSGYLELKKMSFRKCQYVCMHIRPQF